MSRLKSKAAVLLCLLTLIASMFLAVPITLSSPETYGPRLDALYGRFIEHPVAQRAALEGGDTDIWFDIRDPVIISELEDEGFTTVHMPEAFLYYYIDFNVRDQIGNGTHTPCSGGTWSRLWRGPQPRPPGSANEALYYTYLGAPFQGYVPLDEQAFRHAIAHLIPKDQIVADVYEGILAAAIDSLVPPAQRMWFKPGVDGHPYSLGDPTATTVYDPVTGANHDACSILRYGGYVFEPTAPNPAPKHSSTDPDGNWLDPHTGEPMNHITFAGVTQAIAPDSWARDNMCAREFRAIGLPIEHVEVDYGYLTDTMMDYHQFDMYALGWKVDRFPDHLYGFFHSSQDVIEGYNIPGVSDTELDGYLETVHFNTDVNVVRQAAFDAQDRLAELCVSLPIVTRPLTVASAVAGAPGHTDTLKGIVNSPGYGQGNDWTFYDLHWESLVTETNPYGIGGSAKMIVGSGPTNYHPGYASTTDEWRILSRIYDGLININPYTHEDIPWLATSWTIEDWTAPGGTPGMKITFWLRDDVYWHDDVKFTAYDVEFGLEFARDQQIARALPMWQYLVDVEVLTDYTVSVYFSTTSLWIFYYVAGPDIWLVNDAACWATMFPKHIYEGTDPTFRPEETINPINPELTCLIGTGPFVYRGGDIVLGGYAHLTAYRPGSSPVTTHWFMSVEEEDALLTQMFHWIGDVNYDGIIDDLDLAQIYASLGLHEGDPGFDPDADLYNDGLIDMRDVAIANKNYGKARKYPYQPAPPPQPPPELCLDLDITPSTARVVDYDDGIYVVGTNTGDLYVINDAAEYTITHLGAGCINDVRIENPFIAVAAGTTVIELSLDNLTPQELWRTTLSGWTKAVSVDLSEDGSYVSYLAQRDTWYENAGEVGVLRGTDGSLISRLYTSGYRLTNFWLDATGDMEYIAATHPTYPPYNRVGVGLYRFDDSALTFQWWTLLTTRYDVAEVRISENKDYVAAATSSGTEMCLLDLATGNELAPRYDAHAEQFAVDGDDDLNYVIGGTQYHPSYGAIYKYFVLKNEAGTLTEIEQGYMDGSVNDLDSSPDATYLAFGSDAGDFIVLKRTDDTVQTAFAKDGLNKIDAIEIGSCTLLVGGDNFIHLYCLMCRTIDKTLSQQEGYLGDVVHVKLEITVPQTLTAEVVDTLPTELSYLTGTFTVDGVPATPTITKNRLPPPIITEISYNITEPGLHRIEFDIKVDTAYWEDREVCNVASATWYDEENNVVDEKEATACFIIHAFEELSKSISTDCEHYAYLYVNELMPIWTDWTAIGYSPYLDAIGDGNYIEGNDHCQFMGVFGFEDIVLDGGTICRVTLEGYTNGPYDEDCDFDVYTYPNFDWLGSLYATGEPAWVTPRWVGGQPASAMVPDLLTQSGLNSLQVVLHFWTTDGSPRPPSQIDCLRLKVEFTPDPYTIKANTEIQWKAAMSITNPFSYTMKNVTIKDNFGAELEIDQVMASPDTNLDGIVDIFDLRRVATKYGTWLEDRDQWDPVADINKDGHVDMRDLSVVAKSYGLTLWLTGRSEKVHLFWYIGDLQPGETARITILVSTDLNPAGHQEYTEPGIYEMNSGATLRFIDPEQDMQLSAVTDSIYVTVLEDP